MSRTGRCLCGTITYEISGDVIATAVCHCDHCQRQSGGAFSVNLIALESQLAVQGELTTYGDPGNDETGTIHVERRFCGSCGSPIVSRILNGSGVVAIKAGTLDDKTDVSPNVQAWCVDRQPWVDLSIEPALERE